MKIEAKSALALRSCRKFSNETVKQYLPMVAKLCWRYWAYLPPSIKVWLEVEDLIAECLAHVGLVSMPLYNDKSSLTTFIYMNAERYLINLAKKYGCAKRSAIVVSVEPSDLPMIDPQSLTELYETRLTLDKVYSLASLALKKEMKLWFTHPVIRKNVNVKDRDFIAAKEEFNHLASACSLTRQDCQLLLQTGYMIL